MGVRTFSSGLPDTRLDIFLTKNIAGSSRSFIKKLIRDGKVSVNGSIINKPSYQVRCGSLISADEPYIKKGELKPYDFHIDILFEDEWVALIYKPAGISVHPSKGEYEKTLVNALVGKIPNLSGIGGVERPGIVHRLDKNTSGIMLIAKNDFSHNELTRQFKEREIKKTYIAVVYGILSEKNGKIEGFIERDAKNKIKMRLSKHSGKYSVTGFRTIKTINDTATLLEITPLTGRTHQIRVSMSEAGHAIVGDKIYKASNIFGGSKLERLNFVKRQMLHAYSITFYHPQTKEQLTFTANVPEDMLWAVQDTEFAL